MDALGWVDGALLVALLVSVAVGLWRGFVLEFFALASWLIAWVAARWLAPSGSPYVPIGEPGSSLNAAAAFVVAFVVVLVACGLAARVLRMLVRATPLGGADRALGAAFGLVRGVLLLMALAVVVALTPVANSPLWHESHGTRWLGAALHGVEPLLPVSVAQYLPPRR